MIFYYSALFAGAKRKCSGREGLLSSVVRSPEEELQGHIKEFSRNVTRNATDIPPFNNSFDIGMRCVLWPRLNEIDEGNSAALCKCRDGEIQRVPCNLQRAILGRLI